MKYSEVLNDLKGIENIKTKDLDNYSKKLIREYVDVSNLESHIIDYPNLHRIYFQVSLAHLSYQEQFKFIEEHEDYLQDWWHVDQLPQFMSKPIDFDYAYKLAKKYITSPKPFTRRWGYVLFFSNLVSKENAKKILDLMKDDDHYYVVMAEAWLICEVAVYNMEEVKDFLNNTNIKYNILGKAIQKCCDSFRISKEDKEYLKSLRDKVKENGR